MPFNNRPISISFLQILQSLLKMFYVVFQRHHVLNTCNTNLKKPLNTKTQVFNGSEVLTGQHKKLGFMKKTRVLTQKPTFLKNSGSFQKLRIISKTPDHFKNSGSFQKLRIILKIPCSFKKFRVFKNSPFEKKYILFQKIRFFQ